MTQPLAKHFADQMGHLLGPEFPAKIALAVSGGGDSMAMLALAHDWARVFGVGLHVVTVDHGLRPESAQEAAMVAKECVVLDRPHTTLNWHWDRTGNLQDAARRARLSLIDAWRGDINHVLFAHTQDDVAETFLMRLARGAGIEGLSAMAERREVWADRNRMFQVLRPLLQTSRADLRHYIKTLKVPYVDDPSNDDPQFDRVRIRRALADLGIDTTTLSATAQRLSQASDAVRLRASSVAEDLVRTDKYGTLIFDRDGFALIETDTQRRLLGGALTWVSSARYRPRAAALDGLLDRVLSGGGGTLHGAEVCCDGDTFFVFRELNALRDVVMIPDETLWDGRWLVLGQDIDGLEVRALGSQGWAQLPKESRSDLHYRCAQTLPALFEGGRLVAFAPAKFGLDTMLEFNPSAGTFAAYLVSR